MTETYSIYQRGKDGNLKRLLIDVESLEILEKINEAGTWKMRSKTVDKCPFGIGDGIVVFLNNDYYYSGIMTQINEELDGYSGVYTWEVLGVGDLGYLERRVVYPDPTSGSTDTESFYTDTGAISTVVKNLIDTQIGISAMSSRKEPIIGATRISDVGNEISVSSRFDVLLDTIVSLLDEQSMCIRCNWDEPTRKIYYQIYDGLNLTSFLLFSSDFSMITTLKYYASAPDGNFIISAGEGRRTLRHFAYAENEDSIEQWGRIEYYQDSRATEDAELQTLTDTRLTEFTENQEGYSGDMVILKDQPQYRKDWNIGDYVGIAIGDEIIIQRVLQVKTTVTAEKSVVSPTIGTVPEGKLKRIFKQLRRLRADVSQLQGIDN